MGATVTEELYTHLEALDALWAAVDGSVPPPGCDRCQKRFPEGERWVWVRLTPSAEERVADAGVVTFLARRWAVVERVFQAFSDLLPRLRPVGATSEPRGVQGWEWSCIGLHALWDAWGDPRGVIRADLRPALLSTHPDERVEAAPTDYELFYSRSRVDDLAAALRLERYDGWTAALGDFVVHQGLTAESTPQDVLSALRAAGLGRRAGGAVRLAFGEAEREVSVAEFQLAARRALGVPTRG
jgi:hypothetical protein